MCFFIDFPCFSQQLRLSYRTPKHLRHTDPYTLSFLITNPLLPVDQRTRFWTTICLILWKMSTKKCCVPNCNVSRYENTTTLHSFPNPLKDAERFRRWIYAIGGDILALDNQYIYKYKRVCHNHFERKYHTWTKTLSPDAVPTLHLSGLSLHKKALSDITLQISSNQNMYTDHSQPSTSKGLSLPQKTLSDITLQTSSNQNIYPDPSQPSTSKVTPLMPEEASSVKNIMTTKTKTAHTTKKNLERLIKKLRQKKDNYATRLKKALKLSENQTFNYYMKKFSTLAAMFTTMQFREICKDKMGRRFTKEEKIMALSIYKQGPKAYRWLSKLFVLPSPVTLSRLISKAHIKPGINKKLFLHLKKRAQAMSENEKLCVLLFDEIAISPHFDYNQRKDLITGFVTNGKETKRQIADHALVFMLRGVLHNYKQPILYTL